MSKPKVKKHFQLGKKQLGLGRHLSFLLLNSLGFSCEVNNNFFLLNNLPILNSYIYVRVIKLNNIKAFQLNKIKSWQTAGLRRGIRLASGYPVNGQRTKTNANSQRKLI